MVCYVSRTEQRPPLQHERTKDVSRNYHEKPHKVELGPKLIGLELCSALKSPDHTENHGYPKSYAGMSVRCHIGEEGVTTKQVKGRRSTVVSFAKVL